MKWCDCCSVDAAAEVLPVLGLSTAACEGGRFGGCGGVEGWYHSFLD